MAGGKTMKTIMLIAAMLFLGACASDSEEQDESFERTKGMQVTAGTSNTIQCPSRNSECYAQVRKMCGDLGVKEVATMDIGRVQTAGGSDDPFAKADRQKNYNQPVSVRCKKPRRTSE
jgi:hypothetical protein